MTGANLAQNNTIRWPGAEHHGYSGKEENQEQEETESTGMKGCIPYLMRE